MEYEKVFPATMDGMVAAAAFLDDACPNPRVSIVFDEIASNIVRCSGAHDFTVRLDLSPAPVLQILDDGKPFDPTTQDDPDVTAPAEERDVGGLGLFMVKKMSKSFDYVRDGMSNVTTIRM